MISVVASYSQYCVSCNVRAYRVAHLLDADGDYDQAQRVVQFGSFRWGGIFNIAVPMAKGKMNRIGENSCDGTIPMLFSSMMVDTGIFASPLTTGCCRFALFRLIHRPTRRMQVSLIREAIVQGITCAS